MYRKSWNPDYLSIAIDKNNYNIIKYWGFPKDYFRQFYSLFIYIKLKHKIKKGDYDIIHAHCLYPAGHIAMKLSKILDIPYIVTTHGGDFYYSTDLYGKKIFNDSVINIIKNVFLNANYIIAVSELFAEDIKKLHPKINVVAIENTYNKDIFKPLSSTNTNTLVNYLNSKSVNDLGMNSPICIRLLSIGFFGENKNHILLLNAFKDLINEFPNIRLTIIGSGPLFNKYKNFIYQYSLGNFVLIKEFMNHKTLVNEYHNADIFVLTSLSEAFGVVCLEALACGLPVIASNTQGPSKIISDNVDGLLFKNNDFEDLKNKIRILLCDHKKITSMGLNALIKAKEYENKHHDVFNLYEQVINEVKYTSELKDSVLCLNEDDNK
ncbi:MAG: glycosyltransferase family 4 protein [Candidatus Cloacimonetes bacterium]|nr:glycosyltransferase family 4 protein [Candidatus Cloacimonadota bacterium]